MAAAALAGAALASGAESAQAASAEILSPRDGAHLTRAAVVVRARTTGKGFRAYVNGKDVTRRFRRAGGRTRRAVLVYGRDFGALDNRLLIRVGPRYRSTTASATFIHMRRADVSTLRARKDRFARPVPLLRARTDRRLWESWVHLNGDRVRQGVVRHADERGLSVALGAHHGLRYGRNTVAVRVLQRDGRYEVHRRGFRIPRSRTLTGAGPDRVIGVGERVALDGSETRAPASRRRAAAAAAGIDYQWKIVEAPPSSDATLQNATSVRPLLRPDVVGNYTVRLVADAAGAVEPGVDEVSVTAGPSDDPMGAPIQTIGSDGALRIGTQAGTQVWPRCGSWLQVVYLNADLTPDTKYKSPGCSPGGKSYGVGDLGQLVTDVSNVDGNDPEGKHIVIVSGQGRPPDGFGDQDKLNPLQAGNLAAAIKAIGGTTDAAGMTKQGAVDLTNGKFSVIGQQGLTEGHAEQNYIITQAPVSNPTTPGFPTDHGGPGSLNGFMQQVTTARYQYVSTEYYDIDTKYTPTAGAPPPVTTNTIKVGDNLYSAGAMGPGEVGIQFLVLDPSGDRKLAMRENSSWRIMHANGDPDEGGIQQLALKLNQWVRGNTGSGSSQLVIIQDYGAHFGWNGPGQRSTTWVSDTLPDTTGPVWVGDRHDRSLPALVKEWGGSVAGGIGMLAGPAAHDAVAGYRIPFFDPSQGKGAWTSNDGPGLTVVASTNRYQQSSSFFQGQQYAAHLDNPQLGTGRVTGILRRNEQSQLELASSGWAPGYDGAQITPNAKALWDLVFQAPTPWPCSPEQPIPCPAPGTDIEDDCPGLSAAGGPPTSATSSAMAAAMKDLAQGYDNGKHSGLTDIRDLYQGTWITTKFNERDLPGFNSANANANGYTRQEFEALRCQVAREFDMLFTLQVGIEHWQGFLTFNVTSGKTTEQLIKHVTNKIYADMKAVSEKVEREAKANAASIGSDVLLVLASMIEGGLAFGGGPEVAAFYPAALGGLAALISLGDDTFELDPVKDGASKTQKQVANDTDAILDRGSALADDMNARYAAISRTMRHFGDVFVSDWGKLLSAEGHFHGGGDWALPGEAREQDPMELSLAIGAQRAAYDSLLPMAFTQWMISPSVENPMNPGGPGNVDNRNPYRCVDNTSAGGHRYPFDHSSLWALHVVPWIGQEHPQIGSSPQPATPFVLRGLKSKADDMVAGRYDYGDGPRVGLRSQGTTAHTGLLAPLFDRPDPGGDPANPTGLGARKDEVFGSGAWNVGGKPGFKKLQCA